MTDLEHAPHEYVIDASKTALWMTLDGHLYYVASATGPMPAPLDDVQLRIMRALADYALAVHVAGEADQ